MPDSGKCCVKEAGWNPDGADGHEISDAIKLQCGVLESGTPAVTVHVLLETYLELEDVLIGIAPPFKKLRNPIFRKSVAKVATIKHISSVVGVPLDELIGRLREAVGQSTSMESYEDSEYYGEQPDWFSPDRIALSVEEDKLDDIGKMALVSLLGEAKKVEMGEIIELVTSFIPASSRDRHYEV
jgi:hypothetical protein